MYGLMFFTVFIYICAVFAVTRKISKSLLFREEEGALNLKNDYIKLIIKSKDLISFFL